VRLALLKILSDNYLKQAQLNAVVPQNERNGQGGSGTHDLVTALMERRRKRKGVLL
jgi:hypothetical protein